MVSDGGVQRRITGFWDLVAPRYDSSDNVADPNSAAYGHWIDALRSVLPQSPARVLDLGTGTGFAAGIAVALGHQVTGIDTSTQMLTLAQGQNLAVSFADGDAVHPPFPAGSFDVVMSRSLIWTLRQLDTAFCSWFDLLAPAGRVVAIYGLVDPDTAGHVDLEQDPGDESDNIFARHYTPATQAALAGMRLTSHDRLLAAARAAGFDNVTVTALTMVRGWETSPGSHLPYALVGYRT